MGQIDFWQWWILGLVLLVLEVFAPGAFFLWMGIAAGLVGLILFLVPQMGWEYQVLIFAVLSVGSIVVWRQYLKKHPTESDQPSLNRRGEQYVGRVFTLDEPIKNGTGKIHVDDSSWKINGADCEAGTRVKVTGANGVILQVEIVT
jgi:membrane protein implicated in regulation of membrane protease activity